MTERAQGGSGIPTKEEGELVRRAQKGDDAALDRLVQAHLPMLRYLVRRSGVRGCSEQDLMQQGQLGLLHAVGQFDSSRGVRFWTYARWWVRAYVRKYAWQNRRIVPLSSSRANRKVALNLRRVESRLGTAGNPQNIASELGVERDAVERVRSALDGGDISLDEPSAARSSLRAESPSPEEEVERRLAKRRSTQLIHEALEVLDARDREIVQRRFLTEQPETLASVGRRFGISRERVRQLSERALKRLREAVTERDATAAELIAS